MASVCINAMKRTGKKSESSTKYLFISYYVITSIGKIPHTGGVPKVITTNNLDYSLNSMVHSPDLSLLKKILPFIPVVRHSPRLSPPPSEPLFLDVFGL